MPNKPVRTIPIMKSWNKLGFVFFESWVEISFFVLLILGFVLGKLVVDVTLTFLLVAAAGIVIGRLIFERMEDDPVPYYALGAAFLAGFLLGHRVGSGPIIALVFAAAAAGSYHLHKNLDFLA
ncbi:hypothetical protein HYU20_01810 [Candidatus Woesearchaeota archaeon]|nr:hypothetical protein [Candidatus Woesearchaeota archaeon]